MSEPTAAAAAAAASGSGDSPVAPAAGGAAKVPPCSVFMCRNAGTKTCSACKSVHYCSKEHQVQHWKEGHKKECKELQEGKKKEDWRVSWRDELNKDFDLSDPEEGLRAHHREFRKIIDRHGLDKGDKASELADFLVNKEENVNTSAESLAEKFGLELDEAVTLLSFVHLGVRFKEEHLDANKDVLGNMMGNAASKS